MIKRINIFGGAGVGKSTITAKLFAELKSKHYRIEHVTEYIKNWVYESRIPKSWDQLYIFGQQLHREDLIIRQGPIIITDSPLLMQVTYAKHNNFPAYQQLLDIANKFETEYPSINFYIHRKHTYQPEGRYHTEEEAIQIDQSILNILKNQKALKFTEDLSYDQILNLIYKFITDIK